jgi:hypothetical protein
MSTSTGAFASRLSVPPSSPSGRRCSTQQARRTTPGASDGNSSLRPQLPSHARPHSTHRGTVSEVGDGATSLAPLPTCPITHSPVSLAEHTGPYHQRTTSATTDDISDELTQEGQNLTRPREVTVSLSSKSGPSFERMRMPRPYMFGMVNIYSTKDQQAIAGQ